MAIRFSYDTGTFEIGRYHSAPIHLSVMFFVSGLALAFPFWRRFDVRGLVLTVIFIAIFLGSVLLHELAHAYMATRYRVRVERIDLNVLGGLVHLRGLPHTMQQDFLITLAGPVSNLALGLVALVLLWPVMPSAPSTIAVGGTAVAEYMPEPGMLAQLLQAAAVLNIGLFVVNLFPAIPLDGGKLVYLLIEHRWNARTAMLIVSGLGMVFAFFTFFLLLASLLLGCPIWAPPAFRPNLQAFLAARHGRGRWETVAS